MKGEMWMDTPRKNKSVMKVVVLTLILVFALSQVSMAAFITYGDFSGTKVDFTGVLEDSTTDPLPLFGTPTHQTGWDQLLFFPTAFSSYSADGSADTTSGTLQMTITAKPGFSIDQVIIKEYGDYTLTGSGGDSTQANINGLLTVTPLGPGDIALDHFSAEFSLPTNSSGFFAADWEVDFTGLTLPVQSAVISFNNNLQTSSEAGTTAFIQKKVVNNQGIGVGINGNPVPVPGAVWLLGSILLGCFPLIKRRHEQLR
jgi:hypothetical protein